MAFVKGVSGNYGGRPKVIDAEKPTNKSLRNKAFLQLLRRFAPLQSKAVQVAVKIMDDNASSEAGKLKASALIIATYQQLLKETYNYAYDSEEAEEIQKTDNSPIFSLKIVGDDK